LPRQAIESIASYEAILSGDDLDKASHGLAWGTDDITLLAAMHVGVGLDTCVAELQR
jgi:hypothetical protein